MIYCQYKEGIIYIRGRHGRAVW